MLNRNGKIRTLLLATAIVFSMMSVPNGSARAAGTSVPIDESHFPDQAFRDYVSTSYDINKDGILSSDENDAANVLYLRERTDVESLSGIQYLKSLYEVDIAFSTITELDLSKNTGVCKIFVNNSYLRKLNITGLSKLEYLDASATELTYIDISSNPIMKAAYATRNMGGEDNTNYDCKLYFPSGIQVITDPNQPTPKLSPTPVPSYRQANTAAGEVQVDDKNFPDMVLKDYISSVFDRDNDSVLSVKELNEAQLIRIEGKNLKSVKGIELLPQLTRLEIYSCQLSSVNLKLCPNLTEVFLNNNQLKKVDVSGMTNLRILSVPDNYDLSELKVGNTPLTYLVCNNTNLSTLDISGCPGLANWKNAPRSVNGGVVSISGSDLVMQYDQTTKIVQNGSTGLIAYLTVTPTPKPTSSGTSGGGSGSSASNEGGIEGFVERLYTVALGRESDPYGKADWINRVRVGGNTGADLARGFLFSEEFLSKNMSNSDFVDVLYATFFNRPADEHKSDWLGLMDSGWTKTQVIDGFINSTEWANLCLTFGIASGSTFKPNITVEPSQGVIDFATRLYTTCLGRDADQGGLNDWSNQLANMQISGSEAAHGFFFSEEFNNAGISDSEYVMRLYRTFMGREYDQGGYDNWMAALASGQSREFVFQGFAGSAEWAGICADYGILK